MHPPRPSGGPIPVFILLGPTGSGKTELIERLFAGGAPGIEVVSADSMQVYRGMNIGTAKPPPALRAKIAHHLIDIRDPDEPFNAGDFVRLADAACADIAARGKLPVLSGGTGFYVKNFMSGLSEAPPSDPGVRSRLRREFAGRGAAALMEELSRQDPASASRIHINDTGRLLRALEVCRQAGRPLSSFAATGAAPRGAYRFLAAELRRPREELYRRINLRCAAMFSAGLAGEAASLAARGYTPDDPGMRAIGYREFFVREYAAPDGGAERHEGRWRLSGDLEGVQALVARNSRRYAKRQMTFFASLPGLIRLDPDRGDAQLAGPLNELTGGRVY